MKNRKDYYAKRNQDPAYRAMMKISRKKWATNNPEYIKERRRLWSRKFRRERKKDYAVTHKNWRDKVRMNVLEFFGSKCCVCGFSDHRALQLDHIKGDGYAERRTTLGRPTSQLVRTMIASNPLLVRQRYQLLCANCNWIKRYDKQEHKKRVEVTGL